MVVGGRDVRHQLAEVHGFGVRTEAILVRRHGLRHRDGQSAESAKVFGIFPGGGGVCGESEEQDTDGGEARDGIRPP